MNLIETAKKVLCSLMKNISISADNEKLHVNYDNGEISHTISVSPNDSGQPCIFTEINGDSINNTPVYHTPTTYMVIGSAIVNFDSVFGSVYAVCLIGDMGHDGCGSSSAHERIAKLYETFNGASSEAHISSTFIPGICREIDTMINKISDDAYILVRIMRPKTFNNIGTERISCVNDVLKYIEKLSEINVSELSPHLNDVVCDADALVSDIRLEWERSASTIFDSVYNDAHNTMLSSTGHDIAETIGDSLLSTELLSIGECMKTSCGLEHIPEVPVCSQHDSSKFNRFKKKYSKFFDDDVSEYVKLAMAPDTPNKRGD